ncbi:cyclic nucleotide-binding domain-containing protein [Salipiger mucosus]|uniref:Methyl-accepting chemotaxis protein n=1 Tax=Salipiger mucosus DSM 16094 TaxID=1123237 RepID=S9QER5_9RHOB|nr:cyclic nucleotide-binding domain-containing protein [Salipiger mucosus]EPX78048.1 hypothetical protein Salmuc_03370 [Salipiger mucosus DSM 16094]
MAFEAFSPETAIQGQGYLGILPPEEVRQFAESSDLQALEDGEYLFLQGNADTHIYLVISGEIELTGNEFLAGHERVGMYRSGDVVGADAQLISDGDAVHHLSAKAAGDARILKIEASILDRVEETDADAFEGLRQEALVRALEQAPANDIVTSLTDVAASLNMATCPFYEDGETIFKQDDAADFVYLLISGSVRIEKEAADGSRQMLARLRPGQLFGEAGLESGATRRASAVVEGPSCLLKLSVGQFQVLMDQNNTLRAAIKDQEKLYSSRHYKYEVPKFIQNMKVANRIAALVFVVVLLVLSVAASIGITYAETGLFSSHREMVNQRAEFIRSGLEAKISEISAAAEGMRKFVLREYKENPDALGLRSHRQLEVYYVHAASPQVPPVSEASREPVRALLEAAFAKGEMAEGFVERSLDNGETAFFRGENVVNEDGERLGLVLSAVYPALFEAPQTLVAVSGKDAKVPGFPGRASDLRSASDGVVDVQERAFTVSAARISTAGIGLDVFSWEPRHAMAHVVSTMHRWGLIAIAVCAVTAALVAMVLSSWTLQPINHLSHAIRRLSEGQRGLAVPFASRESEVGVLARAIHQLQSTIQKQERIVAERINDQQRKVLRQEENKRSIAAFRVRFDDLIGELISSVDTVSDVSEKLLEGSRSASDGTGNILETFNETRESVEKIERLARELRTAAQLIDTHTETSDRSLGEAVCNMKDANETLQQLNHVVDEVGSIAGTISSIADQTRLLALNATIEASRAGRAGKGFGVVATEVSNLANQTSEATDDIRQKVENIDTASLGVVSALSSINDVIERMRREHTEIRSAVETQTEATRHIADDVGQTSKQAREVSASLDGISQLVDASRHGAEDLSKSSATLKERTDDIRERIDHFLRSVSE